jgi:hypothetical protein
MIKMIKMIIFFYFSVRNERVFSEGAARGSAAREGWDGFLANRARGKALRAGERETG